MPHKPQPLVADTPSWRLSAHALSTARLALVACTLLATVAVLLVVTIQARDAQDVLDEAATQTLRDYSGYSGRMLGADLLRRFSEQRAAILSQVAGSSGRNVTPPSLEDIARVGRSTFTAIGPAAAADSALRFFKLDVGSGRIDWLGAANDSLSLRIADTLRHLAGSLRGGEGPNVLAPTWHEGAFSVAYAPLFDASGRVRAMYGYSYTRRVIVGAVASRVFSEVPLLPVSFVGSRWNYDTTRVKAGEVNNDAFVALRIKDRRGKLLWSTAAAAEVDASPYRASTVISTSAGGMIVDAAIHREAEAQLIPVVVRRAQRWTLRGLIALALLLVVVSLIALRGERLNTQARRVEAMQQLALGIRHEINNALASVMLNAELLNEERSLDAEQRDRLDAIVEQAERMRKVIRRLEQADKLDVLVPYLNEGMMVDLSPTQERERSV